MSAVVLALPNAAARRVRQPKGVEAARLVLMHGQRRLFPTDGRKQSFAELYSDVLKHREHIEAVKREFCERTELSFSGESMNLQLRMAGAVAMYRIRLQKLAAHSSENAEQAKMKREAIGDAWLAEPGSFYDQFRESVARDAARFGTKQ